MSSTRPLLLSLIAITCWAPTAPAQLAQAEFMLRLDPVSKPAILFIRGGSGTGGFLEGGADEQLSDVFDLSTAGANHGWGELRLLLEADGYQVEQVTEGPVGDNTPVDLAALPLSRYDVVVFGSNNAEYDAEATQLLADWVCEGGAALFISDANWGTDWGDAPTSDQPFLDHFDLIMNQDRGTYVIDGATGDLDVPEHPVIAGPSKLTDADDVTAFDGEGVSPLTVIDNLPGVDPLILANAEGQMRLNDSPGIGSVTFAGPDDASLVVLEYGIGRVAGHFDRNTFFNKNGAGTSLHRYDNTQYARNLFAWLVAAGGSYGPSCPTADGLAPTLAVSGCPTPGGPLKLHFDNAPGDKVAALVLGLGQADDLMVGPCPVLISPIVDGLIFVPIPASGSLDLPVVLPASVPKIQYTMQAFFTGLGPGGTLAATNGIAVFVH